MSGAVALRDRRYREPEYEAFRELVGAWITCGGASRLANRFGVSTATVERWYRGTVAPAPRVRDLINAWIASRVEPLRETDVANLREAACVLEGCAADHIIATLDRIAGDQ